MELDKRIMSGKKPLTCFDSEFAKQFIGKTGFVTNELNQFRDLNQIKEVTLGNVYQTEIYCFSSVTGYKYFLPAEWVKEPEKKYRAFTIKEFQQKYSVGSVLKIRQKQNRFTESVVQYVGYKKYEERIYLGITDFTLNELFENFEMIEPQNDTWHPFGVEE